jgi:hypothetical protein
MGNFVVVVVVSPGIVKLSSSGGGDVMTGLGEVVIVVVTPVIELVVIAVASANSWASPKAGHITNTAAVKDVISCMILTQPRDFDYGVLDVFGEREFHISRECHLMLILKVSRGSIGLD